MSFIFIILIWFIMEKLDCICNRPKSNPLSEPLTIGKFANDLIVKRLCVIVGCHRAGRIGSYWLLSSWCHKLWTGAIGLLLLCSALAILFTLNLEPKMKYFLKLHFDSGLSLWTGIDITRACSTLLCCCISLSDQINPINNRDHLLGRFTTGQEKEWQ